MLAATWHVFEGLYELDLHDYSTYNALAAGDAPVKVSDTEYEVTLRDGAKFSDGTDVTAGDVVNAFELNMADGHLRCLPRVHRLGGRQGRQDRHLHAQVPLREPAGGSSGRRKDLPAHP